MIDETVPVTPVTILAISRTAELLVPQTVAHRGVRVMRGGLAATSSGELIGWVACAHDGPDLDCPVWPEQPRGGAFAQLFAGATLTDIVYRGGDWRRASGCVNAHLIDRCGLGATRVETDGAERAWQEVSALIAASGQRLRLAG